MALSITYFGSASNPADNGSNSTAPAAVTPPASMQAGDLVLIYGQYRGALGTSLDISETGGQTWTEQAVHSANPRTLKVHSATFDGTWDADPSITGDGGPLSIQMQVIRPSNGANAIWTVDAESGPGGVAASTTNTLLGVDPTAAPNITIGIIATPDDNTFTADTLGNFTWPMGSDQYRNTSGSDQSATFMYYIQNSTHDATGNCVLTQATEGADAYTRYTVAFILSGDEPVGPTVTSDNFLQLLGVGI